MSRSASIEFEAGAFEALGLDDAEQRIYRTLLDHDAASASEIARLLDVSVRASQRALSSLELTVLCVTTNDPANAMVQVPVSLTVSLGDTIFADGFESGN